MPAAALNLAKSITSSPVAPNVRFVTHTPPNILDLPAGGHRGALCAQIRNVALDGGTTGAQQSGQILLRQQRALFLRFHGQALDLAAP